jgi:molecular chaperone HscB
MSSSSQTEAPQVPDYFAAFALPRRLGIDTAALERAFYTRSRQLHPDLFARKSPQEQAWSLEQSSLLNDAYRTLKDPLRRTEYLLRLEGVRGEENSDASAGNKQTRVPPDLLEEAFELNMQLEEMRAGRKMGEDDPELRASLEQAQTQYSGLLSDVDRDLESASSAWDHAAEAGDAAAQRATLERMNAMLDRRSYLRNLVRDVAEALAL